MTIEEISESENSPLEYQAFALCLKEHGAIAFFNDNLPTDIVGLIHGEKGTHEFYEALLSFYRATNLDVVDSIAFKSWLETDTDIYDALGGNPGINVMVDLLMGLELSTKESVGELVKHKANKRKQINYLHELQLILTQKGQKTEEDIAKVILNRDPTQLDYYIDKVKNMVGKVLANRQITIKE